MNGEQASERLSACVWPTRPRPSLRTGRSAKLRETSVRLWRVAARMSLAHQNPQGRTVRGTRKRSLRAGSSNGRMGQLHPASGEWVIFCLD